MGFPYNDKIEYLNKEQQKHFDQFMATDPYPDRWYENEDGEKRRIHIMKLPAGAKTKDTMYGLWDGANEKLPEVGYRTTFSDPNNSEKKATICYEDEKGEYASCDSQAWMKWLGLGKEIEVKREVPEDKYTKSVKAAIASGKMPTRLNAEEYDELTKPSDKPKWNSPIKKRKSSKKPS